MGRSQRHLRVNRGWDSAGDYENVSPTDIAVSGLAVATTDANGFVIGAVTGSDANVVVGATREALAFTLQSNPGGLFEIVGGNLRKATALTAGVKPITIRATDARGQTFDENFNVTVT